MSWRKHRKPFSYDICKHCRALLLNTSRLSFFHCQWKSWMGLWMLLPKQLCRNSRGFWEQMHKIVTVSKQGRIIEKIIMNVKIILTSVICLRTLANWLHCYCLESSINCIISKEQKEVHVKFVNYSMLKMMTRMGRIKNLNVYNAIYGWLRFQE